MKELVETYFGLIFKVTLAVIVISTLLLFENLTTEFYETPKFIVLLTGVGILLVLLTFHYTIKNKVVFVRTPLDLPLLILVAVGVVSTVVSPAPFVSLLGNQLKVSTSLVGLITFVLFYFLLTNNLKSLKNVAFLINLILGGAAALSVLSLLSFAGVNLFPASWTHTPSFTPTGSNFSTTAVLSLLVPIVAVQIIKSSNQALLIIYTLLLSLFGATIALTGQVSTWIASVLGLVLAFLITNPTLDIKAVKLINITGLITAVIITFLVVALSFIPPVGDTQNPIYNAAKNFPREIQLSFPTSWKISVSAFRDSPFWGSGPSTYLFDFTSYKPIEFNTTKFWNIRFDTAFNEYLQVLASLGGVGLLALVSLTAMFVSSATSVLKRMHANPLDLGLGISGIIFFVLLALHTSSLVVWVIGLSILASFMVVKMLDESGRFESHGGVKNLLFRIVSPTQSSAETIRIEALPSILLVVAVGLVGAVLFFGGKFVLADYHHRQALNAVAQSNGITALNELIAAERLNPQNDLYRTDLAQTNFALANAIALANGPTEASPAGTLTDQDKQNIQILLQNSITEGRTAVALSPRSAINWEILALLYRQISGVAQNALIFSLDSYGRAIFQDPLNPILRLNVGGTYYAIKNYDLAIRFFTDAINLKPDYANGYYNLAVALRDKGDLNGALAAAQKVIELIDPLSPDYKIATDLVNELKTKTGVPPEDSSLTAPTAQDKEALQKEELPDVVDVGEPPEKIATPEAVKKASPTPRPR